MVRSFTRLLHKRRRGASAVEYAALIAIVAILLTAAAPVVRAHAGEIADSVARVVRCNIAAFAGGGSCPGAGQPGQPGQPGQGQPGQGQPDKPWWQKAWDWLTQEHNAQWWSDFLNWIKQNPRWSSLLLLGPGLGPLVAALSEIPGLKGPIGEILSGLTSFMGDLLLGIGGDGKFSWGGVILAIVSDVLIFADGAGLLAKIPGIGRLFKAGGALEKLGALIEKTAFGKWLLKDGPEAIAGLLKGSWGAWLKEVLGRIPKLDKILKPILDFKIGNVEVVKTILGYIWRFPKDGIGGLAQDIVKTILKDVVAKGLPVANTVRVIIERLFRAKGIRDIIKWIQHPSLPDLWPFS
jgi:Flp pilus assembly pilin Flp